MMTEELDPKAALALARNARERVSARAADAPGWYGPLYGLGCGGLVAGAGYLAGDGLPRILGSLVFAASLLAIALLYHRWQQTTGLSVNGYRAGTTRVIAIGLAAALLGLMLVGMELSGRGLLWAPVACGAAAALIAAVASAAWDRAWQRQIRRGNGAS